jgi:hemerythrin superfamily protein
MNAIELLKADHEKVKSLFKQAEAEGGNNWELFKKIKEELDVHTHIEEEILYPRIKEVEELTDIVLEGVEEHHQAKVVMREMEALSKDSEKFEPKMMVLMENVEHHIKEEEEEMFPKIEKLIAEEELEELGRRLEAEKRSFSRKMTGRAAK